VAEEEREANRCGEEEVDSWMAARGAACGVAQADRKSPRHRLAGSAAFVAARDRAELSPRFRIHDLRHTAR
jgi:hypothetical protein